LKVAHTHKYLQDTLGPGRRAVVWVQGCTLRCPGCIVPEHWDHAGVAAEADPVELARQLLGDDPEAQLTVSGGEPTEQARDVALLLAEAQRLGRSTWVYTGRLLEELVDGAGPDILDLLGHTDVLVDGPYRQEEAGAFAYKGSANQRIIRLTDAVSGSAIAAGAPGKVELVLGADGVLNLMGIPAPGFLAQMSEKLAERGVAMGEGGAWR